METQQPAPSSTPEPLQNNDPKKILIVEDDTFLQSLISQKISSKGYTVITAGEGTQAIEIAEKEQPAIVLLDIILPGMNGFDILKRIKTSEKTKHIHVIMLSNLSQQSDIDKAKNLGATDFFVKANTSPTEVVAKIDQLLHA